MGNELVTEGADLAIHDETFEIEMGVAELEGTLLAWVHPKRSSSDGKGTYDGHGWGIVAATGLDADVTVL